MGHTFSNRHLKVKTYARRVQVESVYQNHEYLQHINKFDEIAAKFQQPHTHIVILCVYEMARHDTYNGATMNQQTKE